RTGRCAGSARGLRELQRPRLLRAAAQSSSDRAEARALDHPRIAALRPGPHRPARHRGAARMEAGSLIWGGASQGWPDAPWLSPFGRWFELTDPRADGFLDLDCLNALAGERGLRLENGLPLRFGGGDPAPDRAYEAVIFETG